MKPPTPLHKLLPTLLLFRHRWWIAVLCCLVAVGCSILPVLAQAPDPAASGLPYTGNMNKPDSTPFPLHTYDPLTVYLAPPPFNPATGQTADKTGVTAPGAEAVSVTEPQALSMANAMTATGSDPADDDTGSSGATAALPKPVPVSSEPISASLPVPAASVPISASVPVSASPEPISASVPSPASSESIPASVPVPASEPIPAAPAEPAKPVKPDKPARIPVLNYHSITVDPGNRATITPEKFKEQMLYLSENGYTPLTLKQFTDMLEGIDKGPDKPVLLTFDDGYADNYKHGMPILKELGFHATIFVSPGMVDDGYFLNWEQIKEMHEAGWDIQPHGMTHPHLPRLSPKDQAYQISEAKAQIEEVLGTAADVFCYPYGEWNAATLRLLKELNFRYAFTIEQGMTVPSQDKFKLKRIFVNGEETMQQWKSKFEK